MKTSDLIRSIDTLTPGNELKARILALPARTARPRFEHPLLHVAAFGGACLLCAGVIAAAMLLNAGDKPGSNAANPIASSNIVAGPGDATASPVETQAALPTATDPAPSEGAVLEPVPPELSSGQDIGADMAFLDYASDDIVIFHGYFGLFVYDLKSQKIVRSLDLKPIGCEATQGDKYCRVSVSADGNTVQLRSGGDKHMYVYTVSDNTLRATAYAQMENRFDIDRFTDIEAVCEYQKLDRNAMGYCSWFAVLFGTGDFGYLRTSDWTVGTLMYIRGDIAYRLFGDLNPAATLSPSGEDEVPLIKNVLPEGIISPEEAIAIAKKANQDYYGLDAGNCVVADCYSYSQPTIYGTAERWYPLWKQNAYAGKMVMLINIHKTKDFMDPTLSKTTPYVWGIELWTDGAYGNPGGDAQVSKFVIDAVNGDILEKDFGLLGTRE